MTAMWWKSAALVGVLAIIVGAVVAYLRARHDAAQLSLPTSQPAHVSEATREHAPVLEATLVSPLPAREGALEAEALRLVEVCWNVRNVGTAGAEALQVRSGCRCQVAGPLPTSLGPGESARLSVGLRAPEAGLARREVPIHSGTSPIPLLTLTVAIRVPVKAPSWVDEPRGVYMRGVAGEPFEQEWIWEAVERRSERGWIRDVRLQPDDKASATLSVEQRAWGEDAAFCLRRYRVTFSAQTERPGVRQGLLLFEGESEEPPPGPVLWRLKILPALAVIPQNVSLRASSEGGCSTAQVTVVSRLSGPCAGRAEFDETLIEVAPARLSSENGAMRFGVRAKLRVNQPLDTQVLFVPNGADASALIVQILPD